MAQSADWGYPNTSISAATGTGAGTEFGICGSGGQRRGKLTWFKNVAGTGSWTALQVDIEASIDGTNWFQVDSSVTTTDSQASVDMGAWQYVRANVITATIASLAPTVTVTFVIQ